ncbi:HYC_CC_PP family protein [Croceiramulus getboli]|nr:hypothetical protein P8624_01895 [Flavobacteriaceae bacterium YJPT1-3]
MKKGVHQIAAVLMACVVLFTTQSFAVNMHYCGNTIVDVALWSSAKGCGMEQLQKSTPCEDPSMTLESCCKDQKIVKEGQNDLKSSLDTIAFEKQTLMPVLFFGTAPLSTTLVDPKPAFKAYSPPFLERDIQILYETYLI